MQHAYPLDRAFVLILPGWVALLAALGSFHISKQLLAGAPTCKLLPI